MNSKMGFIRDFAHLGDERFIVMYVLRRNYNQRVWILRLHTNLC